jgi:hypothetical protein
MKTLTTRMTLLLATLLLGACGGSSSSATAPTVTPPTPPPVADRAQVGVSVSPESPVAYPTGRSDYPWAVDWTLVLRETAGLGGNVNYVDVSFVNNFGFETKGALNYGADEIIRRAGTNHLAARGELRIPLSMIYRADGYGGRTILLKNAVNFTDDHGHNSTFGASANVLLDAWSRP